MHGRRHGCKNHARAQACFSWMKGEMTVIPSHSVSAVCSRCLVRSLLCNSSNPAMATSPELDIAMAHGDSFDPAEARRVPSILTSDRLVNQQLGGDHFVSLNIMVPTAE